MARKTTSILDRFNRHWVAVPESGCWLWTASIDSRGYGVIGSGAKAGQIFRSHRVSWELFHGPIPSGMCVCHRCDVRICVNPAHLWIGTQAENLSDMTQKGRDVRRGQAKLSVADVLAVRKSDKTNADLARLLSVSPSVISEIRSFKSWAHV